MKVEVVRRSEVPAIHSVVVNGREHTLGVLKEFWKNERLFAFMPKDVRVSTAWVHLDAGQELDVHEHPVDSMILVCKGRVCATGEVETELVEGDALLVPNGHKHGFVGAGEEGFWGLSMQFDCRGLYEDLDDPWASFRDERDASRAESPLDALLARNDDFVARFARHRLFTMASRGHFDAPVVRERFLDAFQVWSNYFQRMVLARAALSDAAPADSLAYAHLRAEFGHNLSLARDRKSGRPVWDPVLEATAAWFPWKMTTGGELERLVLVHLVVEASAAVFYRAMAPVIGASPGAGAREHLDSHAAVDEAHVRMGVDILRTTPNLDVKPLLAIQQEGWQMLHAIFGRVADLSVR